MKKLIICRHAKEGLGGELTKEGLDQAKVLAEGIRDGIGETPAIVVASSVSTRALRTAEILSGLLEPTLVVEAPVLATDHGRDVDGALAFIEAMEKSTDMDVLVLVTHLDMCHELPVSYGKLQDIPVRIPERGFANATGIMFDLEKKKIRWV